jgi:hypothetical protein
MLEKLFGTSPIPTILGYLVGGITAFEELIRSNGTPTDLYGWMQIALAVGFAVLGRSAKQVNVSNSPDPHAPVVVPPVAAVTPNPVAVK